MFVRHDAVKAPLQPPYDGPFGVVSRDGKFFTLNLGRRHDTVSIDRLKPAYIEEEFASVDKSSMDLDDVLYPPVLRTKLHLRSQQMFPFLLLFQ